MSAPASAVGQTVDNRKSREELARIHWRQRVLAEPGGPEFLAQCARRKERDVSPYNLTFPTRSA